MNTELKRLKMTTYHRPGTCFCWDGYDCISFIEWPLTVDKFVKTVLEEYVGTHIDTILWSPGDGTSLFFHDTEYGVKCGEHIDQLSATTWMAADNGRLLRENGGEFAVLSAAARRLGFNFYVSLRMNDTHDHQYPEFWSPIKEQHPEWLIGKYNPNATQMDKWEDITGLNYALEEVREYKLNIIREIIEKHDLDGFQLDFSTFPPYFKQGEEQAGVPAMNDFMREVRALLDDYSVKRGRYIALGIAVVDDLDDNIRIGLDVPTWVKEGLVDEVQGGRSYVKFYPLDDLINLCREFGVAVYGASNHEQKHEHDRAWAMLHWESGVDGLVLYNYYYDHGLSGTTGDFHMYDYNTGEVRPFLNEIGSPEKLRFLDKTYKAIEGVGYEHPWMVGAFPGVQVPAVLETGKPVTIQIICADDLPKASEHGRLKEARFKVHMNLPAPLDEFRVMLNGNEVKSFSLMRNGNIFKGLKWTETADRIRKGANSVQVELVRRTPRVRGGGLLGGDPELKVTNVELDIAYY